MQWDRLTRSALRWITLSSPAAERGNNNTMSLRAKRGNRILYRVNKHAVERSIAAKAVTFVLIQK